MTIDEALNRFQEIIDNPNSNLDDLYEMVNQLSIDDLVAPENATTHLYTKVGSNKGFINDTIRVLDHTDAFKFLDIFDDEVKTFVVQKLSKNMLMYLTMLFLNLLTIFSMAILIILTI